MLNMSANECARINLFEKKECLIYYYYLPMRCPLGRYALPAGKAADFRPEVKPLMIDVMKNEFDIKPHMTDII